MLKRSISRVMKDSTNNIIRTKLLSKGSIDQLNSCEFYTIAEDLCVVKMDIGCKLYLRGVVKVISINSCLNINGKTLKPGDSLNIFSVIGSSALFIETLSFENNINIENYYDINNIEVLNDIINNYGDKCNIFLLKSLYDCNIHIIEALKNNRIAYFPDLNKAKGLSIFPEAEKHLKCLFDHKFGDRIDRKLFIDHSWNEILLNNENNLVERIMICGGKGFGKSTLLRYLINRSQEVNITPVLVDLDPGQPETFLPGTISYTIVTDPLMGPSYTHLCPPRWSTYVGEVDVDKIVNGYFEAILKLSHMLDKDEGLTSKKLFLINTMGYSRGLGVLFQCAILRAIRPTKLVLLESQLDKLKRNNFSESLIDNAIASEVLDSMNFPNYEFNCKLMKIRAPIDYVYRNIIYPENRLSSLDIRRAMRICYFTNVGQRSNIFKIYVGGCDEFKDRLMSFQPGDIVVFTHKSDSLHSVEFAESLSYNISDCLITIRTPQFTDKEFNEDDILILDLIRIRSNRTQWRRTLTNQENLNQANLIYSTDC